MSGTLDLLSDTSLGTKAQAILQAAGALVLDEGYAAVSMDAVARRAGVSKATLYAHFESKEALFAAIVAAGCRRLMAEAEALVEHDAPIAEALTRLATTVLRFLVAPATLAMYRTVLAESRRDPHLAETFHASGPGAGQARIAAWIAEEQRRGRLRADADPREAAGHLVALLRGEVWFRAVLGIPPAPDAATIAAAAAQAAEVFLRAYGMPAPV